MNNNLNNNNASLATQNLNPTQSFNLPDGYQMPATVAEMQEMIIALAKAEKANDLEIKEKDERLAVYDEKERRRQEEFDLAGKIKAELRFQGTRKTLIARRVPNPEEIAPASDIFDYLEIVDLVSDNDNAKKKGVRVDDSHLKLYQEEKATGVLFSKSSYEDMIEEKFGKKKKNSDS